jgi:hypothetical protein
MPAAELADIDLNNLEKEWVDHVNKVRTFTDKSAETKKKEAEAKAAMELAEATLLRDIRNAPDKFGLAPKPTEGAIKNCVLYQKRYKDAERAYIQAKYENDLIDGVVKTLDHRKRALENLVTLWQNGYFAAPREKKANGVPRAKVVGKGVHPEGKYPPPEEDIPF